MISNFSLVPVSLCAGMGPASVGASALPSAALAPGGGDSSAIAKLAFAECLGLSSSHNFGDSDVETVEIGADSTENSTEQEEFNTPGSALPFFWTPVPQFAPPPPPPSFPDASVSFEENTVTTDGESSAFSDSARLDRGQIDGAASPTPGASGSPQVGTAAVSQEESARGPSFLDAGPSDLTTAKTKIAGGVLPNLDQGGALAVANTNLTSKGGGEFIATAGAAGSLANGRFLNSENKNVDKVNDIKGFKKLETDNGMMSANGAGSMSFVSATSLSVAPPAATISSGPVVGEHASAAVRLVERVAEVAELMRDTPADRVTLKLDLDETHRVEVRVLMREGRVHAEFRSDSTEVRSALSSAWSDFTAKREAGTPIWAQPIFAALDHSSSRASVLAAEAPVNGFGRDQELGQGGSRRQARQDLEPRGFLGASSTVPVVSASVLNQPTPVRDRDRLLSVRA